MPPRFFCFLPLELLPLELLPLELLPLELLPLELLSLELLSLELLPRSLDARRKTSFRAMPGFLSRTSFTSSIHAFGFLAIFCYVCLCVMPKGEKIYLKPI
jgi:hypothetical protein